MPLISDRVGAPASPPGLNTVVRRSSHGRRQHLFQKCPSWHELRLLLPPPPPPAAAPRLGTVENSHPTMKAPSPLCAVCTVNKANLRGRNYQCCWSAAVEVFSSPGHSTVGRQADRQTGPGRVRPLLSHITQAEILQKTNHSSLWRRRERSSTRRLTRNFLSPWTAAAAAAASPSASVCRWCTHEHPEQEEKTRHKTLILF